LEADADGVFEGDVELLDVDEELARGEGSLDGEAAATPEKYEYTDTEQGLNQLLHRRMVQHVAA